MLTLQRIYIWIYPLADNAAGRLNRLLRTLSIFSSFRTFDLRRPRDLALKARYLLVA